MSKLIYSFEPKSFKDVSLFINILLSDERINQNQARLVFNNYEEGRYFDVIEEANNQYLVLASINPTAQNVLSIMEIYDNFKGCLKFPF
jgi:hypothetical protein